MSVTKSFAIFLCFCASLLPLSAHTPCHLALERLQTALGANMHAEGADVLAAYREIIRKLPLEDLLGTQRMGGLKLSTHHSSSLASVQEGLDVIQSLMQSFGISAQDLERVLETVIQERLGTGSLEQKSVEKMRLVNNPFRVLLKNVTRTSTAAFGAENGILLNLRSLRIPPINHRLTTGAPRVFPTVESFQFWKSVSMPDPEILKIFADGPMASAGNGIAYVSKMTGHLRLFDLSKRQSQEFTSISRVSALHLLNAGQRLVVEEKRFPWRRQISVFDFASSSMSPTEKRSGTMILSAFGDVLFVGRRGKNLIKDLRTMTDLTPAAWKKERMNLVAVSPRGSFAISQPKWKFFSDKVFFKIWDLKQGTTRNLVFNIPFPKESLKDVHITEDGKRMIVFYGGTFPNFFLVLDTATQSVISYGTSKINRRWNLSPDGKWILGYGRRSGDEDLLLFDAVTANEISIPQAHKGPIRSLIFSADSQYFLTIGAADRQAVLWNLLDLTGFRE